MPWPARTFPAILRAGRYRLEDRDYIYQYNSPTVALHVYDYVGTIRIGGSEFELIPGDLTITPNGVAARYHLPRPGFHWCIHFYPPEKVHGETVQLPLHLRLGAMRTHGQQQIVEVARLMARGWKGDQQALATAEATLQRFLLEVAMLAQNSAGQSERSRCDIAVDLVASLLATRLAEPLSVPELAEEVGVSQNYLARCFRGRYGATIPHFLLQRRIDYAKELLRTTDIPVQVIAKRCGLGDPQYFNKQFRRLAGVSPTGWREQARAAEG